MKRQCSWLKLHLSFRMCDGSFCTCLSSSPDTLKLTNITRMDWWIFSYCNSPNDLVIWCFCKVKSKSHCTGTCHCQPTTTGTLSGLLLFIYFFLDQCVTSVHIGYLVIVYVGQHLSLHCELALIICKEPLKKSPKQLNQCMWSFGMFESLMPLVWDPSGISSAQRERWLVLEL